MKLEEGGLASGIRQPKASDAARRMLALRIWVQPAAHRRMQLGIGRRLWL